MFEGLNIKNYIIAGLGILLVIASVGWKISSSELEACQNGRKADVAKYEAAQAEATAKHTQALKDKEDEYKEKADKADEAYDSLDTKYRNAVRLYIDAQGKARRTSPAPESGSTQSVDRPGGSTELFGVSEADLLICATNTARLQAARDWALDLNK